MASALSSTELHGPSDWLNYTLEEAVVDDDLWCDFSAAGYSPEKALKEVVGRQHGA